MGIPSTGLGSRQAVFGIDAHEFKPERWLRQKDKSEADLAACRKSMELYDILFGYGSRGCIGQSIANMEIDKVVATLASLFEFELAGTPIPFEVNAIVGRRKGSIG
jgi:cytochrome P450